MNAREFNFDGIVGPTHHYGGLAPGNLASQANRLARSHPRQAALEGLAKMKLLADLGVPQAVLPPHPRPHWPFLKQHGLTGTNAEIIEQAARTRPDLLSIAYSASAMWTANAATVSPSADTADGRVHFTPANLKSLSHRALESEQTATVLRQIFNNHRYFSICDPLPANELLADEGAANQMRLCRNHAAAGLEVFVYGIDFDGTSSLRPKHYLARQTRQASERIAALHELDESRRCFIQQNPLAIDAGVFHNDVIAVSNERVLLCHEQAFVDQPHALSQLEHFLAGELQVIEVSAAELSLQEAVQTYLFNSQLITIPAAPSPAGTATGREAMLLLCPEECRTHVRARKVIDRILAEENPIEDVRFVDVRQSMRNGGGPACLRLRIVLNDAEYAAVSGNVFLTNALYEQLCNWVERHYREELTPQDLADPQLAEDVEAALRELTGLLKL